MLILTQLITNFPRGYFMTLELLEKLEGKIQNAVDTISLLQMEVEELKADKQALAAKTEELNADKQALSEKAEALQSANNKLSEEHQQWQSRLSALVGKIEEAEETL